MEGRGDIDEEGGERLSFAWWDCFYGTVLVCRPALIHLVLPAALLWYGLNRSGPIPQQILNIFSSDIKLCYNIMVLIIIIHVSKRNRSKSTTEMNTIDY